MNSSACAVCGYEAAEAFKFCPGAVSERRIPLDREAFRRSREPALRRACVRTVAPVCSARRPALRAVLTRCWPCKSNSVCLSSCHLPRPEGSIDGLRAFSRNPGRRTSPPSLLLSSASRAPASRAPLSVPPNLLARRRAKGRRVVPMAGLMAKIRKWLRRDKKS
jgi:hypothetical protein